MIVPHAETEKTHIEPRNPTVSDVPGDTLLSVEDLSVEFVTERGIVHAVNGISYSVKVGEVMGIVGESGSGKTISVQAILGLISDPKAIVRGRAMFRGENLLEMDARSVRSLLGREIGLVFQEPIASLNPVFRIGYLMGEALTVVGRAAKSTMERAAALLRSVRVSNPEERLRNYPYELSGGMAQRVGIAMAIANGPKLLIGDEPTTALDVTVQAQVMTVLKEVREKANASLILITHDLGLVGEVADRIAVMYAGRIVETGPTEDVFLDPKHPYTIGLMASMPTLQSEVGSFVRGIRGSPPEPLDRPSGCPFHPRCDLYRDREVCRQAVPKLTPVSSVHESACHFTDEIFKGAIHPATNTTSMKVDKP